jgi:2-dehydropantoate 2-reductase
LARIAATLKPDGTIHHLNEWRFVTFGEQGGQMSERVNALKAAFDRTSVLATAVPNIQQKMWEKIVHLCTIAAMSCLMRASVAEMVRSGSRDLLREMLETNAAIAAAEGYPVGDAAMAEYRKMFADPDLPYTASMLRDLERGGQVEADHVVGFMVRRADAHKIEARLLRVAYAHLKAYEQRRAAGRL